MPYSLNSALAEARDLGDKTLEAALELPGRDRRLEKLLQPLPVRNRADVPSNEGSQRLDMCPDLYRATLSNSINDFKKLLGFTEDITNTIDVDDSFVSIPLQNTSENKMSNNHWGDRVCVDQCMLQEVTAEKNTVLHIAAEQGHEELVKLIILKDNTLMVFQNSRHETPLHLAARAGKSHIVSLIIFLAQESDIGAYEVLTKKTINGETALHEAARHGHEDVIKVLMIVAPALSAQVNNASMSPLYLAVVRKSVGVVNALVRHTHTSAVGPNQQNALHAAVLGSHDIVSVLLDNKAELVNERDSTGSTPLHYAASSGDVTAVNDILHNAPWAVYIQDQEGSSPLHVAARMGHFKALRCMIDCRPDSFELRDNNGRNFLHIVSQYDCEQINNDQVLNNLIRIIDKISSFPDLKKLVNERDNEGNTPLHFASINGFSDIILKLLAAKTGADATLMNNEGKTALDNAVSPSTSFFLMARTIVSLSAYGAIFSPQRQDKLQISTDKTTKWIDKVSKNLIVVSVLIATIAFSAAFNVPGTYNSDGVANFRKKIQYQFFLVFDTIALSTSVSATILLVAAKAVSKRGSWVSFSASLILLWTSLYAMQVAFVLAVWMSLGLGKGRAVTGGIITSIPTCSFFWTVRIIHNIGSPAKLGTTRRFRSAMKQQTPTCRRIDIQFPELASYARRSVLFISLNIIFYFATGVLIFSFGE